MNTRARSVTSWLPCCASVSRSAGAVLLWLAFALALYLYLSLFKNALIDDTFITLNYVKSLTHSGAWGFYPVHITNTATSPLNVLVLALFTLFSRSALESVFLWTLVQFIALAFLLRGIGRVLELRWFAIVAFLALVLNPLLISTLGLETTLYTTLFVASLYFFLAKRFTALAIITALLTLTRPDGVLLFLIMLVFLSGWQQRGRFAIVYAVCLTPWYLFSWIALGSIIPDTFLIKTRQSWGDWSFRVGLLLYARRYPLEMALSFSYLFLAPLALLKAVRQLGAIVWIILFYGVVHFAAYAVLRVPPYHWYYVPEVVCLILLGALAITKLFAVATLKWQRAVVGAVLTAAAIAPICGAVFLVAQAGIPLKESFIHTNWATHEQYRAVGLWLRERYAGKAVPANVEPGTIAYYCDCFVLDHSFTTRDWLAKDVERYQKDKRLSSQVLALNYLFFEESAPYPPASAQLQIFLRSTRPTEPNRPHWFTTSKWVDNGLITVDEKPQ